MNGMMREGLAQPLLRGLVRPLVAVAGVAVSAAAGVSAIWVAGSRRRVSTVRARRGRA